MRVYDGVLGAAACGVLHACVAASGLGHRCYEPTKPRTPVERSISSILHELGDDAPVIEYWSRQEWKHIEAHTDVDETLAAEQEIFRTPRHAHVLYLQVGSKVQGPTCVFDVTNGDELRRGATLTVVPAVAGRLLRFDGSLLHAVPRPHDLWTLPFVSRQRREPAHEWGRAVVLFNTWPDASRPPLGVSWEPPALTDTPAAELSDAPAAACAPAATWSEQVIGDKRWRSSAVTAKVTAKVWLLGERQRRAVPERTVSLSAPDTLSQTLGQPSRVTRVPMDALPA